MSRGRSVRKYNPLSRLLLAAGFAASSLGEHRHRTLRNQPSILKVFFNYFEKCTIKHKNYAFMRHQDSLGFKNLSAVLSSFKLQERSISAYLSAKMNTTLSSLLFLYYQRDLRKYIWSNLQTDQLSVNLLEQYLSENDLRHCIPCGLVFIRPRCHWGPIYGSGCL